MLEVDHVRKQFGAVTAVSDVHFTIQPGSTFGLLGPNGAGKTTTMRMILGILAPDGGAIRWNGSRVGFESRKRFGYLPEERGIYGRMKVREQILYFGKLHGLREPGLGRSVDRWIDRLNLGQYVGRPCSELSKGNQQKVQLACAAMHDPELLVLDEPFSGLDPVNADMLLRVLKELQQQGTTLVLSSHQMWQLDELCSDVCIIAGGINQVTGSLPRLRSEWPTRLVRVAPANAEVRRVLDGIDDATFLSDGRYATYVLPSTTAFPEVLRQLVAATPIDHFEAMEPSLNDIYLHAVGAEP